MKPITKCMKYQLSYVDGWGDFHTMQNAVWDLQRQVREIKNRTIQICYQTLYLKKEELRNNGEPPYIYFSSQLRNKIAGVAYKELKTQYADISGGNLSQQIQDACKKYQNSSVEIEKGTMSVPSYKRDQPIIIRSDNVRIQDNAGMVTVKLTLFSNTKKKEVGISTNPIFTVKIHDSTQRSIMSRIIGGEYKLGDVLLTYEKTKEDKKAWFLTIAYTFTPEEQQLDPNKILGVDLGEAYAIYASSFGEKGVFKIEGNDVIAYAAQLERRRKSKQHQSAVCGDGRIGHGTKTRVAPVYQERERIANYRNTINHRYSRALIDYAVKNGYGVIQMEDLTAIKEDTGFPKRLIHWTYYDLQTKIEYKAKEKGIEVRKINPQYTSQRCSHCGCIDSNNRKKQAEFKCVQCGFEANADYNASQNISIPNIEEIILKATGANHNQTKKRK